jgi:hypothetical protein
MDRIKLVVLSCCVERASCFLHFLEARKSRKFRIILANLKFRSLEGIRRGASFTKEFYV